MYAFGIKHSPYMGTLKGDAWGGNKTEIGGNAVVKNMAKQAVVKDMVNGNAQNGSQSSTSTHQTTTVHGGATTTQTTRVHSDGHRIRTETFSYTKGPTTTTSRVTANRTRTTEVKAIA